MAHTNITFHPSWWAAQGFSFGRRFFEDAAFRIETDRAMRRVLYEVFGDAGLGENDPSPRPLVDSDLLAGEYVQAAVMGCAVEFYDDKLPYAHAMEQPPDAMRKITPQGLRESPVWAVYAAQYEALLREYGRVESYLDLHGVQNLALSVRGTALYEDYLCEPEQAHAALRAAWQCIDAVAQALRRYTPAIGVGVTAIVRKLCPQAYVTSNCTCELVSRSVYEEFLLPLDKQLARVRPFGIHHCGQTMQRLAQAYATLQPEFIEIGASSDIADTLRWFSRDTAVNLRYSPRDLAAKTPAEICAEVRGMAHRAQGWPRLGISCVGVDAATPAENIRAFLQQVREV